MTKTLELTKQLVSIPSWVGIGCNEIQVGEFIYSWLRSNTSLNVIKQPVKDGRFNVVATGDGPTKRLLVGHMDTVENRAGWITDPWKPVIENGRIYGLGATDMKGSLAAMLTAVAETKDTNGLMVLCYIDEEYDFAGMLKFVEEYKEKIEPKLIISLDGSANQVGIGCRGLIELSFKIRGVTGHAGRPLAGKNAIRLGSKIVEQLDEVLTKVTDSILGSSTCNLAYLQGGLDVGNNAFGCQGNNIADLAEFVLDIRTSQTKVNASWVRRKIYQYAKEYEVTVEDFKIRHNLGSWVTSPKGLTKYGIDGKYEPSLGYIDTQMLWETFGQIPCCTIGAGNLALAHKPNEFVGTKELENTYKNIKNIINKYLK